MKTESEEYVKVIFPLVKDEDDFPPFDAEGMFARSIGSGQYEIDQIPFFATGISSGDVITAQSSEDGLLFESIVTKSGNKTMQIYCFEGEELNEELPKTLMPAIETLGCEVELADIPAFFAVNIPVNVDVYEIYNYLSDFIDEQRIDFRFSDPVGGIDIFGFGI